MYNKILKAQFGTQNPSIISNTRKTSIDNNFKVKTPAPPSADLNKMKAKAPGAKVKSSSGGGGIKNMSAGLQQGLGTAASTLGSMSGGDLTAEQNATREGIRSAISSAGPIGAIIGAASGVVDAIGSATGLNLDNIDKDAAQRAGINGKAGLQNTLNSLPGVSMLVGMFGGKSAKSYKSAEIDQMASAYGGSVNDINAAQSLSGKRMLGTGKANRFIREQNRINNLVTDISLESKLRKSNTAGELYTTQNQNKYSGYSPQLLLSKQGMKFPELDNARKLISSWSIKSTETQELPKFQLGGKMNLIPEGALHARRHNLEEVNPELEGQITNKGIPVVVQSEGGVVQQAEIEKEEVVFRKEFTDELEDLYEAYQENPLEELAIKAGKLICYELLKNTDDRSGLIKSVK